MTKLRVNAFLATLASGLSFGGIAVGVTHGGLLITPTSSVFTFIGQHKAGGIWDSAIIFIVLAIVLQLVLAYTVFGRHLYGVGDNRNAARLSGLKVDRTVILTFVITGAACGLAGLIDSSMTGSGTSSQEGLAGQLALLAIAGVALGGSSIFGGVGSVWRTVLGVLMLGMITNGFDLLATADYWQNIIRGVLIILAVALSFVGRPPLNARRSVRVISRRYGCPWLDLRPEPGYSVKRQGHLGAAGYRVADAVRVLGGDLAVVGDREDVLAVFVLVDGEDLGDEADADRVGLAGDRVDGDLHSADIRPRGQL